VSFTLHSSPFTLFLYCCRVAPVFVTVTRPLVFTTRTGLATPTFVGVLTLGEATVVFDVVVVVRLVREVLVAATAGDPEMLAGGLTTEAAVGDSVRTLAKAAGEETALLVGVIVAPEGAITGPAAFVTFVLGLAVVVVPAAADEPAMIGAAADPSVPATTTPLVSTTLATGSPAPLVITSVGPE
jgi:hypothetical protein